MSNRSNLFNNGSVEFWLYESGQDNYGLNMAVDEGNVDVRVFIPGLTSKQIASIAADMISATIPWDQEKAQQLLVALGELRKAIAEWKDAE